MAAEDPFRDLSFYFQIMDLVIFLFYN